MQPRSVLCGVLVAVFAAGVASAQTIDFSLFVTLNGTSGTVQNDTTLPFDTTVGTQEQASFVATYIGNTQATILKPPQQWLSGSSEFTLTSNVTLPLVLNPGDSFKFTVTFSPTNSTQVGGTLTVQFTEPGAGGMPVQNAILLGLQGTAPNFVLSYVLQTTKNAQFIPSGGTIPFGATQINGAPALANLDITDLGSGAGFITGITGPPVGSPFSVEFIPAASVQNPAQVNPGSANALVLVVQYAPTAVENDTGLITITYQGGATATVNLTGNGIASTFQYNYLVQGVSTPVAPGGTIIFPGANVATPGSTGTTGTTSSLIVKVTNTGSASGAINSVSTNPPFTLTNPITLPATLTTGQSFSVPLTFTPTQVGPQPGQLLIGNDFFILSGQGLGPDLTYAYTSNGVTTTVNPATGGEVVFSPAVPVGQSEQVTFTITNLGSLPATISLVEPSVANGPFTVSAISLPDTLTPKVNPSLSFTITFTPTVPGPSNGNLVVATASGTTLIPLMGSGSVPPALPSYTISGPSGNAPAATQSNVSLTLSAGYSLDLTGTLTITTEGTFGTDPTVQFETGSRTVDFTIPANSTNANFAGLGSELLLQTGTVAETVTLKPTFTTTGGVDVTPSSPTTLQFTIASAAPVLQNAGISGLSANSFSLVLTGYSTTRSLSSLHVTFNAATGFNLGTTQLPPIDISQASASWFASSASEALGGLFQITMPFTVQGLKTTQTLADAIASVTATVSNGIGTSNSVQAPVQ
jgi:hypothetical protein